MKKIVFIFSCISILLGAMTLIITSILNEIMPKLGYLAFQVAATGSYNDSLYKMNFIRANFLAIVLIIGGIIISIRMYLSSNNK